ERVEELRGGDAVISFVCECADLDCRERIDLTAAEYEHVRAAPTRFVVRPGHERPSVERVVRRAGHYLVIEKQGEAGEAAAATIRETPRRTRVRAPGRRRRAPAPRRPTAARRPRRFAAPPTRPWSRRAPGTPSPRSRRRARGARRVRVGTPAARPAGNAVRSE